MLKQFSIIAVSHSIHVSHKLNVRCVFRRRITVEFRQLLRAELKVLQRINGIAFSIMHVQNRNRSFETTSSDQQHCCILSAQRSRLAKTAVDWGETNILETPFVWFSSIVVHLHTKVLQCQIIIVIKQFLSTQQGKYVKKLNDRSLNEAFFLLVVERRSCDPRVVPP